MGGIALPTTGGTAYVTNFYDPTGRLTSTQLRSNDHSVINLHEYAYNAGSPREMEVCVPFAQVCLRRFGCAAQAGFPVSHENGRRRQGTRTSAGIGATYSRRTGCGYDDGGRLTVAWTTNPEPVGTGTRENSGSRGYAYDSRRTSAGAGTTPPAEPRAPA